MRCWPLDVRVLAGVLVVAVGPLVAGCGNEKHDFRVQKLDPLIRQMSYQRAQLAGTLRLVRPRETRVAPVLHGQIAQLGATSRRVAVLRPPSGTERKFRRYTRANAVLLASLSRFVAALASGTSAQQARASQAAQLAAATVNRTEADLQHALG